MLPQKMKLCVLVLAVAAGAVFESGCGDTDIQLTTSPFYSGVLVLNPQKGQTIKWKNVTPTFTKPSPCATNPTANSPECTINQDNGLYIYNCPNNTCVDPEVVVGPNSTLVFGTMAVFAKATAGVTNPVSMFCDTNQVTLDPTQLNLTSAANQPVTAVWLSTGNSSQKIANPQITFQSANPNSTLPSCTANGAGGPYPYVTCQFTAPAVSTVYTYWAQSSTGECSANVNKSGTLNLTVQ